LFPDKSYQIDPPPAGYELVETALRYISEPVGIPAVAAGIAVIVKGVITRAANKALIRFKRI
jgi:hypothetical protein